VISLVDLLRRCRRIIAVALVALVLAACSGDEGSSDDAAADRGPNRTPPQTLAGGVELAPVDPSRLLVGDGLAYGQALPSQQAAADAFLEDPEVAKAEARRLYSRTDGRLLGEMLLLTLDGTDLFDEAVLDAFVNGTVSALGDDTTTTVNVAGRPVMRSRGS